MDSKKLLALSFASASALLLASCNVSTTPEEAMNAFDASNMQYDIDINTGMCFSVASIQIKDSNSHYSSQVSHAHVPCSREVLKKIDETRPGKLARLEVPAFK